MEEKTEETATKKAETTSKSAKTKKAAGSEPENAGTTNLGALLKAKWIPVTRKQRLNNDSFRINRKAFSSVFTAYAQRRRAGC